MKKYTLIIALLASVYQTYAQDPQFSQYYANPLYLNPAFAGTARCPRAVTAFRDQWPGIPGGNTYITYSASYDQHIDILSGGVGVLITEDRAGSGTLNTLNAGGMYSYQLNVARNFSIKAAVQATYMQKRLDWDKLTFPDQIDPKLGFVYTTGEPRGLNSKSNVDFSAGLLGYSKRFFIGFATHHITEPNESLLGGSNVSPLPRKYTAHAGAVIPLESGKSSKEASISPNLLYQAQGKFQQLNAGVYFSKGPIVGGLWYRHAGSLFGSKTNGNPDSFIALVGLNYNIFKFGYSYDATVSKLSGATAGSHEFTLAMNFYCQTAVKKFRTLSCPSF